MTRKEMTREEAIAYLKRADVTVGREVKTKTAEALEKAISALDLISHIKDRPCDACDCNKGNGCTRWECVFDEHLCRKEKG